jgi:predicted transcriptional regulator
LKIAFLPVKPPYAEKLINGTKRFEFRRRPMRADVTHIVIYATAPWKRILGVVNVKSVESGSLCFIWKSTKKWAGISRSEFFSYFEGTDLAYAIEIDPTLTLKLERKINPKEIDRDFVVPQSFRYVEPAFLQALLTQA